MATKKTGFIVHPFETFSGKYHASYGNNNKTVKNFNTLSEAKAYLRSKGIEKADYDSPSGFKRNVNLNKKITPRHRTRSSGFGFGGFGGFKL